MTKLSINSISALSVVRQYGLKLPVLTCLPDLLLHIPWQLPGTNAELREALIAVRNCGELQLCSFGGKNISFFDEKVLH
jgi:hypothetical protein